MTDETNAVAATAGAPTGTENTASEVVTTAGLTPEVSTETKQPEATKTFTQEDLDRIVQKRVAKESRKAARSAQLEAENAYLRQRMETATKPAPAQSQGKPTPDKYQNYEDYLEALADHRADQKLAERLGALQTQAQELNANQNRQRQAQEFEARKASMATKAAEKYADFADVVTGNEDLTITQVMAQALLESEIGADVAYYLGNNPEEADRISRLSPSAQVRALVKLEEKVSAKPAPTKTPDPIKPGGQTAKVEKKISDPDIPFKDFVALRKKQIAGRH